MFNGLISVEIIQELADKFDKKLELALMRHCIVTSRAIGLGGYITIFHQAGLMLARLTQFSFQILKGSTTEMEKHRLQMRNRLNTSDR
jgi:hypothetical protein